jgi:7-cyano-7-deazaguanine reductase
MSEPVLGNVVQHAIDYLDIIDFDCDALHEVRFVTHELASLCPVTNQPDISTATIEYIPDRAIIESKSLKLYLWSFRDEGILCERLATTIAHRIMEDAQPFSVCVVIEQQSRGGIVTRATANLCKEIEE